MTSSGEQAPRAGSEDTGTGAAAGSATVVPRARLTRLKINRFRQVKPGTELRFDDGINVLLGRNGTGKTTLLELVCALVRGDLNAYKHETFDLEFDMHVGNHRFTTSAQSTFSIARGLAELASLGAREQPKSWSYGVDFYGPSGRVATAEARPGVTTVTLAADHSKETTSEEASLFDFMFFATPFLRSQLGISTLIVDLFSVYRNCLRLDEGLDVFRSIVDGAILPNIEKTLTIETPSRFDLLEADWYSPPALVSHIKTQGPSLHEPTEIRVDQSDFGVLDTIARTIGVRAIRCSLMLLEREQDADTGTTVSRFGKPTFWITTHRGTTFTHDHLSYGEKRLLAFMYHAACNPQILVADELVNGLHHGWIQACLNAIQGQAFLTSQNPLLLDHLPFGSAEEVQRRFILCDRDEHGEWSWRNMDEDVAGAFFRAYKVGIQHVSEILETKGLW